MSEKEVTKLKLVLLLWNLKVLRGEISYSLSLTPIDVMGQLEVAELTSFDEGFVKYEKRTTQGLWSNI